MIVLHAKDYYLAPAYAAMFAVGGAALEQWFRSRTVRALYLAAAVLLSAVLAPLAMPILDPPCSPGTSAPWKRIRRRRRRTPRASCPRRSRTWSGGASSRVRSPRPFDSCHRRTRRRSRSSRATTARQRPSTSSGPPTAFPRRSAAQPIRLLGTGWARRLVVCSDQRQREGLAPAVRVARRRPPLRRAVRHAVRKRRADPPVPGHDDSATGAVAEGQAHQLTSVLPDVPVLVRRPLPAAKAWVSGHWRPQAGHAPRVEGVPGVEAGAHPQVVAAGLPEATWAPDARASALGAHALIVIHGRRIRRLALEEQERGHVGDRVSAPRGR